jgi:serine/threonine-protein kinase
VTDPSSHLLHDEPIEAASLLGEHPETVLRAAFGKRPSNAVSDVRGDDSKPAGEAGAFPARFGGGTAEASSRADGDVTAAGSAASFARELQASRANYEIVGEISRGGMGVILHVRDHSLERDVAVKVLREDLSNDASVLHRFIAEAQIGGQLQHPGVVPVYELGRTSDQRPFFAMKLIRGRTLAQLLADRTDPAQDAHRFLTIFEQICQTIAYAHTSRVIHRDLKPANVMVGAFGEVQIVDWGLAKSLVARASSESPEVRARSETTAARSDVERVALETPRPHSLPGSIMGTPAYMPPEQARGAVAEIDERSDVFALGAMLCEILTGRPPYTGEASDVRDDAAHARTGNALARLDASGADPELCAICKRCLAAERDARPRDASVLTGAIAAFLARLEQRARAAEIAVAEARVKVEDERKARRLTVALALSIVATLAVGGAAVVWTQRQHALRQAETTERVSTALDRATAASGHAEATHDLSRWEEAVSEIDRAQALVDAGDPTPELASRTRDLVSRIHSQAESTRRQTLLESSNRELLAKLQEFHAPAGETNYPTDWSRTDAEFAQAFRDHGLDVDALPLSSAAEAIRAHGIDAEIAAGLDEWAAARRNCGRKEGADRLAELAVRADPDVTRARLRAALARGDANELVQFARTEDLSAYPATTLNLLTSALDDAGASAEALLVARVAERRKPDDFVSNVYLARLLRDRPAEAARYFEAALAIRPDNLPVINDLGWILDHYLYDHASAIALYRRALVAHPNAPLVHLYLGHALRSIGDTDGAIASYREVVRLDPSQRSAHAHLGTCLIEQGDFDAAIRECREAIRLSPDYTLAYLRLGDALLAILEPESARDAYREARRIEPGNVDAIFGEWQALDAGGEYDAAIECARSGAPIEAKLMLRFIDAGIDLSELVDVGDALRAARADVMQSPADFGRHRALGLLLRARGSYAESLFELRTSHLLCPPQSPSFAGTKHEIEDGERLVKVEQSFDRGLAPSGYPFDVRDPPDSIRLVDLGELALRRGLPVTAATLFDHASSGAISVEQRIDRVSAAVRCGWGRDDETARLAPEDGTGWRARSFEWMRAEVDTLAKRSLDDDPKARDRAARELAEWRRASSLARVREDDALAALPEDDRKAWLAIWTEIGELTARVHRARPVRAK